MSIWLDTRGRSTLGIAVCARCSRKMSLDELFSDPNSPGLRVCREDLDELDPYRLPPRQPDNITLPFVRPDLPLNTDPSGLVTEDDNSFLIGSNDEYLTP
ncbi:hypothetical protein UFOVP1300_64 [uncultured Caudovirales phage]|jgi:hypothetical protein|uniref:Uncharacterized protein n=1 Tax=uncultured Caudovirales phage TaxID=2100421 RepID=A0A6J5RPI7_9CAUD|nr:hypothetical protein UFOVP1068_54 [uncultured Caudovirales phage]CAB4196207.1 hypothetical protein UFOVP1300_64 [uncultured Caudovirales phage]